MRSHEWTDLHATVIETASSLFSSVGLTATYSGIVPHGQAPWSRMVAVIGLGGAKLRGSLVLSMPDYLLLRSHPVGGTCQADLADWLSEQANLLLGRIKARLLAHDVAVELSTPLCLAAAEFGLMRFGSTPHRPPRRPFLSSIRGPRPRERRLLRAPVRPLRSVPLAATDALTGLMNRRAFSAALRLEIERSQRHHHPLSLLVLDIDHFKATNDRHGHGGGDRVLAALGNLLGGHPVRRTDVTGRWGGEEFVVAYFATKAEDATVACERLRAAIEELVVTSDRGDRIPVTPSLGLAELRGGESAESLIERADLPMYESMARGRNRLTVDDAVSSRACARRKRPAA